jgi:hypothetical protein
MPLFACRWPSGDVSFVLAANKEAAVEQLDEIANAEGLPLVQIPRFMLHLKLTDSLKLVPPDFGIQHFLELEGLGEDTDDVVWHKLYPKLYETMKAIWEEQDADNRRTITAEQEQRIRAAVEAERERLDNPEEVMAQTEIGKELKQMTDMPASIVNKMASSAAKQRLQDWDPKKDKKH